MIELDIIAISKLRKRRCGVFNNLTKAMQLAGGEAKTESQIPSEPKHHVPNHYTVPNPLGRNQR